MEDYHNRIEELEQALSSGSTTPSSTPTTPIMRVPSPDVAEGGDSEVQQLHETLAKTQQRMAHIESENQGLQLELETLRQCDRQRGEDVANLHQQIEDLEQERDKLLHENDILSYVKKVCVRFSPPPPHYRSIKTFYVWYWYSIEKWEKVYFNSQSLERVCWTILDHIPVPLLSA